MLAIRAWNLMGGEVNWQAIPLLADLFGVVDVDRFVSQLCCIREGTRNGS